ncbi:pyruvate, water dikinase regulatory protein [Oceaniserpentilla sp. 4NH20-0058]|uniref:posphoenolpyruvate synthetase regulatory kinase/phosphorylase PpsR n=1 Tax=Oceaniserpentilla sp. 4NH20-0058 TaxID=3127660 RepID=UPI0031081C87
MKRQAFFISDGTGITAETLGHSLLSQFESIDFEQTTLPYIDTLDKAKEVVLRLNAIASEGGRAIVFDTIINQDIRDEISKADAFKVDIFATFLAPLEKELNMGSSYSVGKSHAGGDNKSYLARIDAVNYALDNDDGSKIKHYNKADIILVGVSRSGKTPSCLYLALQYGIKAANYPLTEEDLGNGELPEALKPYKDKLFGLTIDPERLAAIRNERKANSRYASLNQCYYETEEVEMLFRRMNIPFLTTTDLSVEEISTRIMVDSKLIRRA